MLKIEYHTTHSSAAAAKDYNACSQYLTCNKTFYCCTDYFLNTFISYKGKFIRFEGLSH